MNINECDIVYTDGEFYDKDKSEIASLFGIVRGIYEYCSSYEKAAPLSADSLSKKYRSLAEFNDTVLAAKYNEEYGFEFVTWFRSSDGKSVCNGNYFSDYSSAKENFAIRSGLISKDKLFCEEELERLGKCVEFTLENDGNLHFDEYENFKRLTNKISGSLAEQRQSAAPEMSM